MKSITFFVTALLFTGNAIAQTTIPPNLINVKEDG
jgi:hypothetical protein